jgi:hypothetical protein
VGDGGVVFVDEDNNFGGLRKRSGQFPEAVAGSRGFQYNTIPGGYFLHAICQRRFKPSLLKVNVFERNPNDGVLFIPIPFIFNP